MKAAQSAVADYDREGSHGNQRRGHAAKEAEARRAQPSLAPPPPDPRYPEAVLETAPRVAGIDVHKMSLTCTVLVEDDNGQVESETRQYRT